MLRSDCDAVSPFAKRREKKKEKKTKLEKRKEKKIRK